MTDDPFDSQPPDDSGGGRRSSGPGGGAGLTSFLPLLLTLFRGKGIFLLLILAAGAFFLFRSGGCDIQEAVKKFSESGYNFSPAEFNKAAVYEGLEDDPAKNPLPEAVSLLRFAPERLNQGRQGSCVAWSCAYAAQTILTAAATGQDPNGIRFSPSYLYNQIRLDDCQGSYLQRAMDAMSRNGGVPLRAYPYDENDCLRQPGAGDIQAGRAHRIHGFTRITNGDNINEISIRGIKEHLANNAPVAIGMMVGPSFMQDMMGQELWTPQGMDESQMGMGGHAMCVIGYDDRKFGGAFQIMNSWGSDWGKDGVAWVRYADFKRYVREAYGIDPLPKRTEVANIPLECQIGLVNNADSRYLRLRNAGGNYFETESAVPPGTRFKVEIKNATECYIYIFGQETDGSSYVLFPYLKPGESVSGHAPYCGITGYRLFPKGQSLETDSLGSKDYIALVVSRDELDYNQLNQLISQRREGSYQQRVNGALQELLITGVRYNSTRDGALYFRADANTNKAVAMVVGLNK